MQTSSSFIHIITYSSYGHIPIEWKIHRIIFLYSKQLYAGDPISVKNYRPISLLSNTSKVLEHLVYNKIIDYVSNIICPSQFGFTEKSSTLQQILVFLDVIINSSTQIDVIYLYIWKAFDSVSYSILLEELWSIGITGNLWAWFKNYLMDRFQKVSLNNNLSKTLPVVSGVNDITSSIQHNHLLQFADVLKLFHLLPTIYFFKRIYKCIIQLDNFCTFEF